MKTKKYITRFSLVMLLCFTSYLPSCDKEEWCVDCQWICTSIEPLFGGKSKTICADSREGCVAEVLDWLDGRFAPDCWDCTEPYLK